MPSIERSAGAIAGPLGIRIIALLSLALLPLGLVAVFQTSQMVRNIRMQSEATRLALTAEAAIAERELIHSAFGAAGTLAAFIDLISEDPARCRDHLASFVSQSDLFIFAGFISADGVLRCASQGEEIDYSQSPNFRAIAQNPVRTVRVSPRGDVTKRPVVLVSQPVMRDGVFAGIVTVSLPHFRLSDPKEAGLPVDDDASGLQAVELLTFNAAGEVLDSRQSARDSAALLPSDTSLSLLAQSGKQAFSATDSNGKPHIYAIVPIIDETAYVLGIWRQEGVTRSVLPVLVFPLLMWLATLAVAYFAVHRLVIRHVRRLQRRMRRYSEGDPQAIYGPVLAGAPKELQEMEETLNNMTDRIMRDQAGLENLLHEKNVLLKEVHHRVKNNLQLIVSIMNMQIRRAHTPEAKNALKRVQDRVMGLATIHRNLYQTESLGSVRADQLLSDIAGQLCAVGLEPGRHVKISVDLAPITLAPDHAVPLSLLLTEAMTNALKYLGHPDEGEPWIRVELRKLENDEAELSVENSAGTALQPDVGSDSTGLGTQLMAAFAQQLGATLDRESNGRLHRFSARFPVLPFDPTPAPDEPPFPAA